MKYAVLIARILLGLVFLISGVNHIVPFLPMKPMSGDAGTFSMILLTSKYLSVVGVLDVIGAVLLLVGRYVPLALVLLGPIIVNILLFDVLLASAGLAIGVVIALLEVFLIFTYRANFAGIFQSGAEPAI